MWLVLESNIHIQSYLGFVNWIYMDLRGDDNFKSNLVTFVPNNTVLSILAAEFRYLLTCAMGTRFNSI